MSRIRLFSFFLCYLLLGCNSKTDTKIGFYHWSQSMELGDTELDYLKTTKAQNLYVHFFDITWSKKYNAPVPEAVLSVKELPPEDIDIIPTIYITVEALAKLENDQSRILDLAKRSVDKINDLQSAFPRNSQKVQVDCDWDTTTKETYFLFLKLLQQHLGENYSLSATIRLHQVKYFDRTGVPPVSKGMLMFYNMGNVTDATGSNSIFDQAIAAQYFKNFDNYPLPLNVALPIFSWAVEFKENKIVDLNANITKADLNSAEWMEQTGENTYRVKAFGELGKNKFKVGITLSYEAASKEDLNWAARQLKKQIKNDKIEVVFYNLEAENLETYPPKFLYNCANQLN